MSKYGGNLGASGCVAWMFEKRGIVTIELDAADEDTIMELAMEAGAEDISTESGSYEVVTTLENLEQVRAAIEAKDIPMVSSEVIMQPQNSVKLDSEKEASSMLKLYELLEEADDVQKVWANFDIDEELLEKLA